MRLPVLLLLSTVAVAAQSPRVDEALSRPILVPDQTRIDTQVWLASHVLPEQQSAASAVQTTKQPQRRKSLACRSGRHHWEPKRAKRARRVQKWRLDDAGPTRHTSGIPSFRECTECGRRQYLWPGYRDDRRGLGGPGDGDGDDTRDPGAGQAGRRRWFDDGDSGDGGDGGDWGGGD